MALQVDQVMAQVDVPMICMDVANGYSEHFVRAVSSMRERHPTRIIVAGNVVTGEMVEELLLSGADIVKVHKLMRTPSPH
jgi:GMP reductase